MSRITIEQLGVELRRKRGDRGLREVAKEIGISTATLSRIETGKQPDLDTFSKICKWLRIDASEILGCAVPNPEPKDTATSVHEGSQKVQQQSATKLAPIYAHFRADKEMSAATVGHLSELILAVQEFLLDEVESSEDETGVYPHLSE